MSRSLGRTVLLTPPGAAAPSASGRRPGRKGVTSLSTAAADPVSESPRRSPGQWPGGHPVGWLHVGQDLCCRHWPLSLPWLRVGVPTMAPAHPNFSVTCLLLGHGHWEGSRLPHRRSRLSERPTRLLVSPQGPLGLSRHLSDMEDLDQLPRSSKTPGFCYKGDGVTAELWGRAEYGCENSPPRPGLGGSL